MTKLDSSIPYRKVLMVLPKKRIERVFDLKEGFSYGPFDDDLFEPWCALQTSVNLFSSMEQARDALTAMLEKDRAFFETHFLFVKNEAGQLAASAGLWPGCDFDEERLRVHYVACDESCQHQGIARAMLTKLGAMYDSIPSKYPLYLSTQSQSYGAIALYASLGFTPYLGAYRGSTREQSEQAWEETTRILKERGA